MVFPLWKYSIEQVTPTVQSTPYECDTLVKLVPRLLYLQHKGSGNDTKIFSVLENARSRIRGVFRAGIYTPFKSEEMFSCTSGWGCTWDICCISEGKKRSRERVSAKQNLNYSAKHILILPVHTKYSSTKPALGECQGNFLSQKFSEYFGGLKQLLCYSLNLVCVAHCPSAIILYSPSL